MEKRNIYVIGVSHSTDGLASIVKTTLNHIVYAAHNNLIPIVDLKHYKNPYFKDDREFKDNIWEYFFEQPEGFTLDDIKEEDNIILSENTFCPDKRFTYPVSVLPTPGNKWELGDNPLIKEYKKYLKFNKETLTFLETEYAKKINNQNNILGVICRGTDYVSLEPSCHPKQPTPEEVLEKAKQLKSELGYEKIYLATEDASIYKKFLAEFGDTLIPNTQYMYEDIPQKTYLTQVKVDRKNHHYNLAKEYLSSLYILSKCKYLIGGRASGTLLVYLMTNGFEYENIWSLGYFGVPVKPPQTKKHFFNFFQKTRGN